MANKIQTIFRFKQRQTLLPRDCPFTKGLSYNLCKKIDIILFIILGVPYVTGAWTAYPLFWTEKLLIAKIAFPGM